MRHFSSSIGTNIKGTSISISISTSTNTSTSNNKITSCPLVSWRPSLSPHFPGQLGLIQSECWGVVDQLSICSHWHADVHTGTGVHRGSRFPVVDGSRPGVGLPQQRSGTPNSLLVNVETPSGGHTLEGDENGTQSRDSEGMRSSIPTPQTGVSPSPLTSVCNTPAPTLPPQPSQPQPQPQSQQAQQQPRIKMEPKKYPLTTRIIDVFGLREGTFESRAKVRTGLCLHFSFCDGGNGWMQVCVFGFSVDVMVCML